VLVVECLGHVEGVDLVGLEHLHQLLANAASQARLARDQGLTTEGLGGATGPSDMMAILRKYVKEKSDGRLELKSKGKRKRSSPGGINVQKEKSLRAGDGPLCISPGGAVPIRPLYEYNTTLNHGGFTCTAFGITSLTIALITFTMPITISHTSQVRQGLSLGSVMRGLTFFRCSGEMPLHENHGCVS
jgi:hypothetical protein